MKRLCFVCKAIYLAAMIFKGFSLSCLPVGQGYLLGGFEKRL